MKKINFITTFLVFFVGISLPDLIIDGYIEKSKIIGNVVAGLVVSILWHFFERKKDKKK